MAELCLNQHVPESLNSMLYMPLFKKGQKQNPDCYRGISLIHPLGKMLSMLILNCLESEAE